ncbi:MAG: DUF4868 domain-containing protein [Candidatus Marsarchaeota archaeon]|nr:DUF4868 domain-containing protein [Candidatus Marsarchaeota archaeon]
MPTELERLANYFEDTTLTGKMIFGIHAARGEIELRSIAIDNQVKETFRIAFLRRAVQLKEYRRIVDYSPNGFGTDEVHRLNISDIPTAATINIDTAARVGAFDERFIKKIKFVVFRFTNRNGEVVSVFKYYPKTKFLAKHNAYIITGGTLKISRSNILGLAPAIDCVTIDNKMLIVNRNQFEKIFDYNSVYLTSATTLFNKFDTNAEFKITNINDIQTKATKALNKLRRLHGILTSNSYSIYDFALIKRINSDCSLGIGFEEGRAGKKVTFPDVTTFMELYEDAYLTSPYTQKRYLALSKRNMQNARSRRTSRTRRR